MPDPTAVPDAHTSEPRWQCPDPRQLPELRGKLAGWLAKQGPEFYLRCLLHGSQEVRPPGPLPTAAAWLAQQEHRRILSGDLYWVSAEMTELAHHAGCQLSRYELYEHDLPSRSGFMVFQNPIARATDSDGVAVDIVAVSWGLLPPSTPLLQRHDTASGPVELVIGHDWVHGAICCTFYSDHHSYQRRLHRFPDPDRPLPQDHAPVLPDNEMLGALNHPEQFPDGDLTSTWGKTVIAAWLLMRQPVTAHSTERPPRPARRRLQRAGLPTGDVQLIHVRRPQRRPTPRTPDTSEAGEREYTVRWWVEGHWRRYHVGPGRSRTERRWISPYLAGPDDKPVQGTERVKIWDR
jgi:hypothetical protein